MNATRMDAARSLLSDLKAGNFSALPVSDFMIMLVGVLYVISPIDFLPEVALGPLGLGDDMGVMALIGIKLLSMLDKRAATMGAAPDAPSHGNWQAPRQGNVVPGEVIR